MWTLDSSRLERRTGPRPAAVGTSMALLAGTATAVAVVSAALVRIPAGSPLRAPLTVFFLLVAPGVAVAATLPRLDPLSRSVLAFGGAAAVNLLVAECLVTLGRWSLRGGVLTIAVLSVAVLLLAPFPRRSGRTGPEGGDEPDGGAAAAPQRVTARQGTR